VPAAGAFREKMMRPNQIWRTDFTYLKVTGWGRLHLSTIPDDDSRCVSAWKLYTTMKVGDVIETRDLALQVPGCSQARFRTSLGCSATTGPITSRAIWPVG